MPLEALRYDVTPIGMHYLLTHFDIPEADEASWIVSIGGRVRRPVMLSMDDVRSRPAVTMPVTMECAGNGRARLHPRPISQPWLSEAIGTAEWTGTPLRPLLEEASLEDDAVELVFTGADHGMQGGIEQDYERSLSIPDAMRDEVLLAYAINGQPLPPQHGFPLRLLVPGWYGMTSVKWLRRITAVAEPFEGFQMDAYRLRQEADDAGVPVTRMHPRALMIPPGFPEFFERTRPARRRAPRWRGGRGRDRAVDAGRGERRRGRELGRRSSGALGRPVRLAPLDVRMDGHAGEHELVVRATDDAGDVQPLDQPWNHHGLANNMAQRVPVTVR